MSHPVRTRHIAGLMVVALMLAACLDNGDTNPPGGRLCTAIFAMITVHVRDANGAAVTGLEITDTVVRTHEAFDVPQENAFGTGTHVVFSDSDLDRVRESGDNVRVTGKKGDRKFSADFTFGSEDGCHVRKLAGPDTVVVE